MSYTIAFAGKGGTGKTTLAALTIRYLIEKKAKPVLAVDADSNACLNESLGVSVHATIGDLREQSLEAIRGKGARPGGMSSEQLFDYQVQQSIIEADSFDLLVMGRPEGPGCYCAANNIIRKYTDKLSDDYSYVVLDNEAGMEHLSRRTTHKVDLLLMVSDPTKKGIQTIKRINALADDLKLEAGKRVIIVNRVSDQDFETVKNLISEIGMPVENIFNIPDDENIFKFDLGGKPVFDLPADSKSIAALFKILDSLNIP
ncbi:MAG: AAA family ATPase [Thermodesulfovibrionia bacterium]|nr:AAA family ATPase [Thermodesulfovibrionia bacterium]